MNFTELKQLESLGIVLPTPAYLVGAILFGIIGWIVFRRGRKTSLTVLTWMGIPVDRDRSFWFVVTGDSGLS